MLSAKPKSPVRSRKRGAALFTVALTTLAACGSSGGSADETSTTDPADAEVTANVVTVQNQGGSLEGHTPRGFEGMGVGLFAGDELNGNFPQDDGVQIWLTFDLPADVPGNGATLRSNALTVRGNPFEALGNLEAAPVRYDAFGPQVVFTEPVGASVTCPTPVGNEFSCDLGDTVANELAEGRTQVQLRLRFEGVSDPDGEQDLALFFLSDSNTNEPGIFELELR